jgi:F420 biosynthesis protein FbiB-like protein
MIRDQKLIAAIPERQSIRRFHREPVARAVVERLLAAATRAPSAHNRQPWRFAVLDDETSKQKLAKAMGERLRADRVADGHDAAAIDADVSRSYSRITEAPIVIVVCADVRVMDRYPDCRRSEAEYLMAVQSTAMAAQNLLLAAHSEGLGACVMCAPLFCPDVVTAALDLPAEWRAQMLITVGEAANGANERPRLAAQEVTIWISGNGSRPTGA